MSSTKRVSGDYKIYANNTIITGNLTVIGTQAAVDSIDTYVKDTIITLNYGETGAGVTATYAGVEVDRGSLSKTSIRWNESLLRWEITNDGSNFSAIATLTSTTAAGSNRNIQFNNSGVLGADNNFNYYANGNVVLGTTFIANNSAIFSQNNTDLSIFASGTGVVFIQDTVKLAYQVGSTPLTVANTVQILANTPGNGGTGLYVVNSSGSDELISKSKALIYALIFG
jgi:hypothetical protein